MTYPIGHIRLAKGYFEVKCPDGKWRRRNRWILQQKLGRELLPGHDAHHKNGLRLDDRLENLEEKEHGRHTSDHLRCRPKSVLHRIRISRAMKGVLKSAAHKANLRNAQRARYASKF